MTTIYDIAKKTGYSITTVSKVINNYPNTSEKAKRKVLEAIEELGYMPNSSARTLATNKSWLIGVVYAEHAGVGMAHPFFSEVLEYFKKQLELYNYDLLFVSRNIDLKLNYHDHLRRRGVDGVLVIQLDDSEVHTFENSTIPTVFIDKNVENGNTIHSDGIQGSMIAVDYLYELGHRKIAHISGNQSLLTSSERLKGFKMAMEKYGLTVPDNYIVDGGYYSYEGGREAMLRLLSLPDRPTAVYVSGDEMAIGAMKTIKDVGLRIPEDISIIGFDNLPITKHIEPPLTTISQNKEMLGTQAAVMLLNEINGVSQKPIKKLIPVRLVKRNSCQRLNDQVK